MKKFRDFFGAILVLCILAPMLINSRPKRRRVRWTTILIAILLAIFVGEIIKSIYDLHRH